MMEKINTSTGLELFNAHSEELTEAIAFSIEQACKSLNYDIRGLDWFSYNPDFYIEKENIKVA